MVEDKLSEARFCVLKIVLNIVAWVESAQLRQKTLSYALSYVINYYSSTPWIALKVKPPLEPLAGKGLVKKLNGSL